MSINTREIEPIPAELWMLRDVDSGKLIRAIDDNSDDLLVYACESDARIAQRSHLDKWSIRCTIIKVK